MFLSNSNQLEKLPFIIFLSQIPQNASDPTTFLEEITKQYYKDNDGLLDLPLDNDLKNYELKNLRSDQADIAAVVLSAIRRWLKRDNFQQCNMTVIGVAGSGKSVLIKTLVTAVRRMFQRNDVVHVCAPTDPSHSVLVVDRQFIICSASKFMILQTNSHRLSKRFFSNALQTLSCL